MTTQQTAEQILEQNLEAKNCMNKILQFLSGYDIRLGGWAHFTTQKDSEKVTRLHFPLVNESGFVGELTYGVSHNCWRMQITSSPSWAEHPIRDKAKELGLVS